jgi:hypothetical protein
VPERLPSPGPSFLREHAVTIGDRSLRAGMSRPSSTDEGWWLTLLWISDETGIVSWRDLAPRNGPPPDPPMVRLGPILSGGLSGLILEEAGRLSIRLAPIAPPDDPNQPWRSPAALRAAFKFEPARVATLRPNELAETVLSAFRQSIETIARR